MSCVTVPASRPVDQDLFGPPTSVLAKPKRSLCIFRFVNVPGPDVAPCTVIRQRARYSEIIVPPPLLAETPKEMAKMIMTSEKSGHARHTKTRPKAQ